MWLGERWGRVGAPAGWEAEPPGSGAYSWNQAGWGGGQGQAGGLEQERTRRAGLRLQPSPVLRGAPSVQDNPSVPAEGKKPLEPRKTRLGPGITEAQPSRLPLQSCRHFGRDAWQHASENRSLSGDMYIRHPAVSSLSSMVLRPEDSRARSLLG